MAQRAEFVGETAVRMMMRYAWAMVLYYSVHIIEENGAWNPTLCINGKTMWVNLNFWRALTRDQRMTAILHELWHKALMHCTRMGNRNPFIWNRAGDFVINLMLVDSGCAPLTNIYVPGTQWAKKPFNWCYDTKYRGMTTEQVYDALIKEAEKQQKNMDELADECEDALGPMVDVIPFGKDKNGKPVDGQGDAQPEKQPDGQPTMPSMDEIKEFEQQVRKEVERARTMAKMAGKGSIDFDAIIGAMNNVKIPWQDALYEYLNSFTSAEFSYHRYDRRAYLTSGFIAPDLYTPAMGPILVMVDESGSTQDAIPVFNTHFKDIVTMVKPEWVEVRYHTDKLLKHSQRFERGEVEVELRHVGTGGTSFKPGCDYIREMEEKPAVVVWLTDLYGDDKESDPGVPVVWACCTDVKEHKFGRVISIN